MNRLVVRCAGSEAVGPGCSVTRLALGAACLVYLAGCQTPPSRSPGIRALELSDISGHADFIVRHRERDLKSKTGTSETRSKETIFEESLSLRTDGYVLHPNLLEFGLGTVFGLVQEDFQEVVDGRKRDDSHSGDLLEFDLDARIFKKRAYPTTVFAHRRRGLVARPFLPSLETTTTRYGLTSQYVSKKTPLSLQFSHTDATLNPLFISGTTEEDGRQKNTELRFEAGYHFNDYHTLSLVYEHESVEEEPFKLDYDADEVTLTHQLEFGDQRQHRVRSELDYLNQRGSIDIERARWREDLRLKHSDTLQSLFHLEALDRTRGGRSRDVPRIEERSLYVSGSLRHQLFQSQTSQLQLFAQKQEFEPELEVTRWGGQASINYRKTNPWGQLQADYSLRVERNDHEGSTRANESIDEVHTFRDPDPITLGSRNVIVGSITVRAEDRVTIYQRGWDYSIRTVGNLVEIQRMSGGRIADGETVLVDYLFEFGGTFQLDTVNHNFGIRQDFDIGLAPYYRFESQDQRLSPASATGAIAEDITAHVVGLEYRKPALRFYAEYEDRDSTINPYVSTRLGSSYTHRFKSGAETALHARWTDMRHGAPNERDINLLMLEGRHRHPITPDLTFEGSVLYRDGEDSVSDDTEGVDVSLSLEWFVRETKIRLSLKHSEYEDAFTWNDSSALFVHVRRDILGGKLGRTQPASGFRRDSRIGALRHDKRRQQPVKERDPQLVPGIKVAEQSGGAPATPPVAKEDHPDRVPTSVKPSRFYVPNPRYLPVGAVRACRRLTTLQAGLTGGALETPLGTERTRNQEKLPAQSDKTPRRGSSR
jgi:hypothetical protein